MKPNLTSIRIVTTLALFALVLTPAGLPAQTSTPTASPTPSATPTKTPGPCPTDSEPTRSVTWVESKTVNLGETFTLSFLTQCNPYPCSVCNYHTQFWATFNYSILQEVSANPLPQQNYGPFMFRAVAVGSTVVTVRGCILFWGAPTNCGPSSSGIVTVIGPSPTPSAAPTPTPEPCCPGDADNSGGLVDAADFISVQANFGGDAGIGGAGDADCSGSFVDAADFIAVQNHFGAGC